MVTSTIIQGSTLALFVGGFGQYKVFFDVSCECLAEPARTVHLVEVSPVGDRELMNRVPVARRRHDALTDSPFGTCRRIACSLFVSSRSGRETAKGRGTDNQLFYLHRAYGLIGRQKWILFLVTPMMYVLSATGSGRAVGDTSLQDRSRVAHPAVQ